MDITVTQDNLAKALNVVGRVASNKAQLPILNNILLRTDGNRLLVAATNLEIATTQYVGVKIVKPGDFTVPARLITDFVGNLPKTSVHLVVKDDHLYISAGSYHSVINGIVADEFPELPTIDETSSIQYSIVADDFKQAVNQTVITASSDSTRPVLTGVYWHSYNHNLYLAATDGYRLAERKLVPTTSDVAAIIPTQTLQEVLRSLTDEVDEVDILFDETQVRFRVNETEIVSRLIDGHYPDYKQLIPKQSETSLTLNKAEFSRVVKIAGLFAREAGGSVTIKADAETQIVSIHSVASELGENTSELTAKVVKGGQVTLNSRYISDALNTLDGDSLQIRFSGKLSPVVFTIASDTDEVNYYHIIMPLKS